MSGGRGPNTISDVKKKFTFFKEQLEIKEQECSDLKAELKESEERDRKNETELSGLQRRIQLLEEELDSTSTRLETAQQLLDEASKAADESERARKVLESRENTNDDRIDELEKLVKAYHQQATEWEGKYEEVARKNVSLGMSLSTKEDQCEDREKKLHESDCQLEAFSSSIKSFQVAIDKYSDNEALYEAEIEKNKLCIAELTSKYDELQGNYRNSIRQINELEEENSEWKNKHRKLTEDFDSAMASLDEF